MATLSLLQFILVFGVVIFLLLNYLHLVKVEPFPGDLPEYPFVSVCVPARNEERGIEECLVSLLEQDYPNFEVIVVDDNSTDATPQIIQTLSEKNKKLIAVKGEPLPPDWLGKPFALFQARKKARGEYIIFADADPIFSPVTLKTAVHTIQEQNLDVLSMFPKAIYESFWERAVQPIFFGFIASLTRFRKVNSREYPDAMGVGAFLMINSRLYDRMGGHERLKQAVLDDIELAKLAKDHGARLLVADAKKLFSIRMYHSLDEICQGWKKNLFIAMRKSILRTLYYIFIIIGFILTPYLVVLINWALDSGMFAQALAVSGLFAAWTVCAIMCLELRVPVINIFVLPAGAVIFSAIMINSMVQILFRGQTEWRGRKYSNLKSKSAEGRP